MGDFTIGDLEEFAEQFRELIFDSMAKSAFECLSPDSKEYKQIKMINDLAEKYGISIFKAYSFLSDLIALTSDEDGSEDIPEVVNVFYLTESEAKIVLRSMTKLVDNYGRVSVNDYYDICGEKNGSYAYDNYGWKTTEGMDVRLTEEEMWTISMPTPVEL